MASESGAKVFIDCGASAYKDSKVVSIRFRPRSRAAGNETRSIVDESLAGFFRRLEGLGTRTSEICVSVRCLKRQHLDG